MNDHRRLRRVALHASLFNVGHFGRALNEIRVVCDRAPGLAGRVDRRFRWQKFRRSAVSSPALVQLASAQTTWPPTRRLHNRVRHLLTGYAGAGPHLVDEAGCPATAEYFTRHHLQIDRLNSLVDDYAAAVLDGAEFPKAKANCLGSLRRIEGHIEAAACTRIALLPAGMSVRRRGKGPTPMDGAGSSVS